MIIEIGVILGVFGAYATARGMPLWANLLWLPGNALLLYHNYVIEEWAMFSMFAIYLVIAVFGVWNLKYRRLKYEF